MGSQRKVLVIGSGGREHAIGLGLAQSKLVSHVFVSPGNAGTEGRGKLSNVPQIADDDLVTWCREHAIDLVVVGPELPLSRGISDVLGRNGVNCFGPSRLAAEIESSKYFAKSFMDRHGIPTARWLAFTTAEDAKQFIRSADFDARVIKADGLAGGKGVVVAPTRQQAEKAVDEVMESLGDAAAQIIVEDLLEGDEVSVLCFTDGKTIRLMPPSQDHKRLLDNDEGPNTGGMGAYCPSTLLSSEDLDEILLKVFFPAIKGLSKEGRPYIGVLYAGLMLTREGPKVLEFNCRFGDPETQVILPLLESDLYLIMQDCVSGKLSESDVRWRSDRYYVGTVVASDSYPKSGSKGQTIGALDHVDMPDVTIIHAGTKLEDGKVVTNGGRVLTIVADSPDLAAACRLSRLAASRSWFEGHHFRKDIGSKGISRHRLSSGRITYESSGVNIAAGDRLVEDIKVITGKTEMAGVVGGIGGFASIFDPSLSGFKDPLIVTSTDGVGTKLLVAQEMGTHDSVGVDLVAMCANDVLTHGAQPLLFLDYLATGKLDRSVARDVILGVKRGCQEAQCALVGGETAELPGMMMGSSYDVGGFVVGLVERTLALPNLEVMQEGDVLIGLSSSGIHSNGFSLVRKILTLNNWKLTDSPPFPGPHKTIGEALLTPTEIYVKPVLPLMKEGLVKGAAHITGGGIVGNLKRVVPRNLEAKLDYTKWDIPALFGWLATEGGVDWREMLKTFNLGIGFILIVDKVKAETVLRRLQASLGSANCMAIGHLVLPSGQPENDWKLLKESLWQSMRPFVGVQRPSVFQRKRCAVLISGTGTNLRSLIKATMETQSAPSAEVVFVVSNVPGVMGLQVARDAGIPHEVVNHKDYSSREDFERRLHDRLLANRVDIICLAGFMRILTHWFVNNWKGRLINIHPSLLPSFKGLHTHRQVLKSGAKFTGSTVHFVVDELDSGEIISQAVIEVLEDDNEDTLQERVKLVEHELYPKALEAVASGKITLKL